MVDHEKYYWLHWAETLGASAEREQLFAELTYELKEHAAAEEQALWSCVRRKPESPTEAAMRVAEHKKLDDLLNELAARDMGKAAWLVRLKRLGSSA